MPRDIAREIFDALDHRIDDRGGLRAAHHAISRFFARVEDEELVGRTDRGVLDAELAVDLRRLRDLLLAGRRTRTGEAAGAIDEVLERIGALLQRLARRALARMAAPSPLSTAVPLEVPAVPRAPWLQVELPMRARVWAALSEVHRTRREWEAGRGAFTLLPDTLRAPEIEAWLRRHDALADTWSAVIAGAAATAPFGAPN